MFALHTSSMDTAPTAQALEARVRAALEVVRPRLQQDGGDLEFLGLDRLPEGLFARVRLHGHCRTCPSQPMTMKHGLEAELRRQVPEVAGVRLEEAAPGKKSWNIY